MRVVCRLASRDVRAPGSTSTIAAGPPGRSCSGMAPGPVPLSLATLALAACSDPPPIRAEAWPEADALFRQDPRWLGADAALTVDLGGDRVLWLFGDTFVAKGDPATR